MRQFKFRGWDSHLKIWCKAAQAALYFETGGIEISQWTGLKDSKEQEIYEGDVVVGIKKGPAKTKVTGRVVWDSKRAGFKILGVGSRKFGEALLTSIYKIEVIGNTFQNPELLNE